MSLRAIYCPGPDKWVPIRHYVKVIRIAKANPEKTYPQTLTSWAGGTDAQIMREFREGWMDRVNQAIPYSERGRR